MACQHSWFWDGMDTAFNDIYRCANCGMTKNFRLPYSSDPPSFTEPWKQ